MAARRGTTRSLRGLRQGGRIRRSTASSSGGWDSLRTGELSCTITDPVKRAIHGAEIDAEVALNEQTLGQPPNRRAPAMPMTTDARLLARQVWRKLGQDTGGTHRGQHSGVVASANLPIGTAVNVTNDAFAEEDRRDQHHGPHHGGAAAFTTPWNVPRWSVGVQARWGYATVEPGRSFTGKAYATTYYMGDTEPEVDDLESYSDVTART
jgi:hypothetical protein